MTELDTYFNNEDAEESVRRDRLREGFYNARVVKAEAKIAKSGNLMLQLQWRPIDEEGETVRNGDLSATQFQVLPLRNPGIDGHRVKNLKFALSNGYRFLMAINAEIPRFPKWNDDEKKFETENGFIDSKEEVENMKKAVNQKVAERLLGLYQDPSLLVDTEAVVKVTASGDSNQYRNVNGVYSEEYLPETAEVITDNFVDKG